MEYPQLPPKRLQHRSWHRQRILKKGSEKAGSGKLKRKSKPIMIATLVIDHHVVGVIQMKIPGQLIGIRIANVATITSPLFRC